MVFDPSITGLGYAPEEQPEETDNYPYEDEDMDEYYELKYTENGKEKKY